eukprot:COSAG05_NODE_3463_length_2044_cov_2.765039_2_plen_145_part_00
MTESFIFARISYIQLALERSEQKVRLQDDELAASRTRIEEGETLVGAAQRELEGLSADLTERAKSLQTALEGQQHGERAQALLQQVCDQLKADLASVRAELRTGVATWQQERAESQAQLQAAETTAARQAETIRDLEPALESER